ncbi:SusD-like starch-binding protein associating with outer membrane [Chitinophaga niastensis]|uniref:SusD-like starch-binding protein associating with outer membrane n=1 Tax=Chitinophaga niastensis TaxID=536980 RepID=A0A2P8HQ80_CHINA|nr:RagB/SusD family nutrient uptake outer membrane protein [Chitinophaga niastensis]PSL48390.1 SusD-like starch-binding protein associating with outer membrane [Chitinophaga niastensis]
MKKNIVYHIAFTGLFLLTACSKQLGDVNPNTQISPSQLNKTNLPLVVNGAKLALTNNGFYNYYVLQDIMSDDMESLALPAYEANNVPAGDTWLTWAYQYPYQCIGNANLVINYATQFPGDTSVQQPMGEAFLLRAYSYMLLSEQFGGVVIVKGNENPKSRPGRDSVGAVNSFIEADLKQAAANLHDYTTSTAGSKQAAQLLLARLYLNGGRNDEALLMANAVISSGRFTLQPKFTDIFKSTVNTSESLYKINEASTSGSNNSGLPAMYGPGSIAGAGIAGSGTTWADSFLVKSYEPTDVRGTAFVKAQGTGITKAVYFLTKFPQEITPSYVICRYSEALLIVAEANARKGIVDVTTYNLLRSARKASTHMNSDFATPQAFLDEIEQERRREFIGERMRWNDMRRFGKINAFLQSFQQPASHVLLPLPSREFTVNPNLEQNQDYTK